LDLKFRVKDIPAKNFEFFYNFRIVSPKILRVDMKGPKSNAFKEEEYRPFLRDITHVNIADRLEKFLEL